LGLTITRRFTEILGGSASVESREGEGTTFVVRLPAPATPEEAPAPGDPGDAARPTGDRVLVIDDDPSARDLVRRFLARDGLDVIEAASGDEGLRMARKHAPSVIILDVMMPGMDGWAVLSALRSEASLEDIPVVMLTMVQERGLGFALGVDAYLTKPVDRARLAKALLPYRIEPSAHSILLVEDDAETREMIARVLRKDGWQVVEAEHGEAAIRRLDEGPPDLILLDLMMPVMDGFQVVDAVRGNARWRDIPLVVVTAKDILPQEAARLEGSVQQILQKGKHSHDDLLAEVRRYVRQALQRRGGPRLG
jgi:CheY-like chemotaxis protein